MTARPCILILMTALLGAVSPEPGAGGTAGSPYLPESGAGARRQRALEIANPGVVLFLALQPGYEDLALLARLRLGTGVRTAVVYATNGESTPADAGGTAPVFVAAQRKEEALRAATYLGAAPYFLNLPDPGVVPGTRELRAVWNEDSVVTRLAQALRYFRPDLVVTGGDRRGAGPGSLREQLLAELAGKAVARAGADLPLTAAAFRTAWVLPSNKSFANTLSSASILAL